LSVLDTIFWQKSLELTGDGCLLSVVGCWLLVLDTIFWQKSLELTGDG
jgi:predicted lipid carrier protein YhbT